MPSDGRWAMGVLGDGRLAEPSNLLTLLFADAPLGARPSSRSSEGRDGVDDRRRHPGRVSGADQPQKGWFLTVFHALGGVEFLGTLGKASGMPIVSFLLFFPNVLSYQSLPRYRYPEPQSKCSR